MDINQIISLGVGFAAGFAVVNVYMKLTGGFVKEVGQLLTVVGESIEDGKLDTGEIASILKEAKDLPEALKGFKEAKKA